MEELYTSFALITAGVSLAMGTIYLFIAINEKGKTDLLFSLMAFALTIFFLFPPIGFILQDEPPYPAAILFKRIFIFSYYGITPWFIINYTGYPSNLLPKITSTIVVMCYVMGFFSNDPSGKPLWSVVAVVGFGMILYVGVKAGLWQYFNQDKEKARWLLSAISIYGILFLLTAINQLTDSGLSRVWELKLFFPIHMHALFFMMVMGLRLVVSLVEKHRLEGLVRSAEQRWRSFMQNAPVVVLEIDKAGKILYINNFGVKLLGYHDAGELLHLNWFDRFLLPKDVMALKNLSNEFVNVNIVPSTFKNSIRDKRGRELVMNWVNFISQHEDGATSIMSIGRDVSSEESANRLVARLQHELEKEKIHFPDSAHVNTYGEIVGTSKALIYALQKAKQVATTHAPVLLEGETGVGKELFADMIHRESSRSDKPFIKVNCGALPKELIEDELFGHEKGAFTSAIQARKGRFELADGGTIFLDEIGELPLDMQPKLLRVLQSGEFERVGGQKTIKVDVRILAATNRNLSAEIQKGTFREDLYYRLNVFPITIPPLRNREEDLSALIHYFIRRKCIKYNKKFEEISKANMQRLLTHTWPGNIRELKNVIERAVIVSEGKTLTFNWRLNDNPLPSVQESNPISSQTLEQIERDHILAVIEKCHWRINGDHGAAEVLAMHPNTLRSKMKKLGIKRPQTQEVSHLQD